MNTGSSTPETVVKFFEGVANGSISPQAASDLVGHLYLNYFAIVAICSFLAGMAVVWISLLLRICLAYVYKNRSKRNTN